MVVDAYAHVGMPRFQTVEHYQQMMVRNGIERAVLCSFDSCPDLQAIHAAMCRQPDRFCGIGVPLGRDRTEMEAGVRAQLDAGFCGLRLSDSDVRERSWLLDIVAEHAGLAVICGRVSAPETARILAGHLERRERAIVIGGHFGGGGDPADLGGGALSALFGHPRFRVVFSRHGGYPAAAIEAWAWALIETMGWERLLWGSEAPVLFWRNETIASGLSWADRFHPDTRQRALFFGDNAAALFFSEAPRLAELKMPFEPRERSRPIPATMWANALPVEQAVAGRLVAAWQRDGGAGTLGDYLESLLCKTLPGQETSSAGPT